MGKSFSHYQPITENGAILFRVPRAPPPLAARDVCNLGICPRLPPLVSPLPYAPSARAATYYLDCYVSNAIRDKRRVDKVRASDSRPELTQHWLPLSRTKSARHICARDPIPGSARSRARD